MEPLHRKLNYLTVTRPDISSAMSIVNQFLNSPCDSNWDVVIHNNYPTQKGLVIRVIFLGYGTLLVKSF